VEGDGGVAFVGAGDEGGGAVFPEDGFQVADGVVLVTLVLLA
jgi:hypothetical protein